MATLYIVVDVVILNKCIICLEKECVVVYIAPLNELALNATFQSSVVSGCQNMEDDVSDDVRIMSPWC